MVSLSATQDDPHSSPPSSSQPHDGHATTKTSPAYAFTQFATFELAADVAIEDDKTKQGQVWAQTVKFFVELDGTGLVWWGRTVDRPHVVKLVVDWENSDAHDNLRHSAAFHAVKESWQTLVVKPVDARCYALPSPAYVRHNALSQFFGKTTGTIFTFSFPSDFDREKPTTVVGTEVTQEKAWEYYWREFSEAAMRSKEGVTSTSAGGWPISWEQSSTTPLSFCGILRWKDIESSRNYLQNADTLPWSKGGLERLKEFATAGVDIEHVDLSCFKHGWLGSVTQFEPAKAPSTNAFGSKSAFGS